VSTLTESYEDPGREAQALKIQAMVEERMTRVRRLSLEQSLFQNTIPILEAKVIRTPALGRSKDTMVSPQEAEE
jgi:hypothetical protein